MWLQECKLLKQKVASPSDYRDEAIDGAVMAGFGAGRSTSTLTSVIVKLRERSQGPDIVDDELRRVDNGLSEVRPVPSMTGLGSLGSARSMAARSTNAMMLVMVVARGRVSAGTADG